MKDQRAPEDVIFLLRSLFERAEVGGEGFEGGNNRRRPLSQYVLMKDWERLFTKVQYELAFELLRRVGCGPRLVRAVMATVTRRTVRFKTAFGLTEPFTPGGGGAQGNRLTCDLALLIVDCFLRGLCAKVEGTVWRGVRLRAVVWVDDLYGFPSGWTDLQVYIDVCARWERATGIRFNRPKSGFVEWNSEALRSFAARMQGVQEGYGSAVRRKVTFKEGTAGMRVSRVVVSNVEAGSQAAKAGVRVGWKVVGIDGVSVDNGRAWERRRKLQAASGKKKFVVKFAVPREVMSIGAVKRGGEERRVGKASGTELRRRAEARKDAASVKTRVVPGGRVLMMDRGGIKELERFTVVGFTFDKCDNNAHALRMVMRARADIQAVARLPVRKGDARGLRAEAVAAMLNTIVARNFQFAALAWSCTRYGVRRDTGEVQRELNKVVRDAAWCRSLVTEQLYRPLKAGGFAVVHLASAARQSRLASVVRMLNSGTAAAEVFTGDMVEAAARAKFADGSWAADKPRRWSSEPADVRRLIVKNPYTCMDPLAELEEWRISGPDDAAWPPFGVCGKDLSRWAPKAFVDFAGDVAKEVARGAKLAVGSDAGVKGELVTVGFGAVVETGGGSSTYAECRALEYVSMGASLCSKPPAEGQLAMCSDSKSNVDAVNRLLEASKERARTGCVMRVRPTSAWPSRLERTAELFERSWRVAAVQHVNAQHDTHATDRLSMANKVADDKATRARDDPNVVEENPELPRSRRWYREAAVVGVGVEAERKVVSALRGAAA
eukprot:gene1137-8117_t